MNFYIGLLFLKWSNNIVPIHHEVQEKADLEVFAGLLIIKKYFAPIREQILFIKSRPI